MGVSSRQVVDSHDEAWIRKLEDLVAFSRGELPGDRLRNGSQLPGCQESFDELDAVWQADGHDVAEADAQTGIGASQAVGALIDLAEGDRPIAARDRDATVVPGGRLTKAFDDGHSHFGPIMAASSIRLRRRRSCR
jgi:hypothetical protein